MTKSSTSFNKQFLEYLGFIQEMYQWRGSLWLLSSKGYREQRKFERIEAEKKRSCLASMGRFISIFEVSNCLGMVNIIISIFPILVFLKQLINLSSFSVIHFLFLISKKTSAYIIFQKLKNIDCSYIVLKTLNNINFNNFSLGDPCCEINFGKTKSLKIARSFCAKVFLRIISIKLFVIWQV